jgi:regulator of nonsense transcripts 3
MATAVAPPTAPARMRTRGGRSKEQSIAGNAANGQQPAVRLKAVVRHLPSMLKESEFREAMSNYINDDTTDHFVWEQGKVPQE